MALKFKPQALFGKGAKKAPAAKKAAAKKVCVVPGASRWPCDAGGAHGAAQAQHSPPSSRLVDAAGGEALRRWQQDHPRLAGWRWWRTEPGQVVW
jgi:hypothetical protein